MNRRYCIRFAVVVLLFITPALLIAQTDCEAGAGPLRRESPPQLKPEQIIQKFTANESRMESAWMSYTFTQDVTIQTRRRGLIPNTWDVDGEYRLVMDVSHDDKGRRVESVSFAPQSTLRRISLGREDMEDIRHFSTFALTTDELPHYNVRYAGQQKMDELETYVFDVAAKSIEKGKRYYQGRIWVETRDLEVVKTCGKSVPDVKVIKKKRVVEESIQPKFVTYRERIDGRYWFPTFSRSDDVMEFPNDNDVYIHEVIRFTDYHPRTPTTMASGK